MASMQSEAAVYLTDAPLHYDFSDLDKDCSSLVGNRVAHQGTDLLKGLERHTLNQHNTISYDSDPASSHWIPPGVLLPLFSTPPHETNNINPRHLIASADGPTFGSVGLAECHNGSSTVQHDAFYPLSTSNVADNSADYSFLHRRTASSCSSTMKQYIHSRANSSNGATDVSLTPESTPKKRERYSAIRTDSKSLTPRSSTLSRSTRGHSPHKATLESLHKHRQESLGGRSIRSSSSTPVRRGTTSIFANTKRLPLRLPRPPLCLISDPHADLCSHLIRHGMELEAQEFESAGDITADFALRGWIQTSEGGAIGLLNETSHFLDQHAALVKAQIEAEKESSGKSVPLQLSIPLSDLDVHADEKGLTPTHILAVYGSGAISKASMNREEESKGILIPCHSLMYALQCVSLPAFPPSTLLQEGDQHRTLPVLSLRVPRPAEYPTLHRFIYSHDTSALLVELLPMKHIARHWDHLQSRQQQSHASTFDLTAPSSATDALSHLPTQTLLGYAYKIHSGWANGVAIGLLEAKYWSTLDRAWNLIIAALSIKKARILGAEMTAS